MSNSSQLKNVRISSDGRGKIDIRPLKSKALNFSEPLKSLILSEPDAIDAQEFILKLGTWEKLAKMSLSLREVPK